MFTATRAISTARWPTSARAIAINPKDWLAYDLPRRHLPLSGRVSTRRSPTTTLRSGSIPTMRCPTMAAALPIRPRPNSIRAVADFTRAIEIDPTNAGAYSNRASIYEGYGKFDLAIADYSKAIEIIPTDAGNTFFAPPLIKAKGDVAGALADYDRAISSIRKIPTPTEARRLVSGQGRHGAGDGGLRQGRQGRTYGRCWRRRRRNKAVGAIEGVTRGELSPRHERMRPPPTAGLRYAAVRLMQKKPTARGFGAGAFDLWE